MSPAATSTMLLAALEYADHGDLVFPVWAAAGAGCACGNRACDRPGKHPIGSLVEHGLKDASRDPGVIARWWTAYPHANIGLLTGITCTVLDIDLGKDGAGSLARLEAEHGPLPVTPRVHSGGGGVHLYFKVVPGLGNSISRIADGLDIRGEDGYIVVPPSNHTSGGVYADNPDAPLYELPLGVMPRWLVTLAQLIARARLGGLSRSARPPRLSRRHRPRPGERRRPRGEDLHRSSALARSCAGHSAQGLDGPEHPRRGCPGHRHPRIPRLDAPRGQARHRQGWPPDGGVPPQPGSEDATAMTGVSEVLGVRRDWESEVSEVLEVLYKVFYPPPPP